MESEFYQDGYKTGLRDCDQHQQSAQTFAKIIYTLPMADEWDHGYLVAFSERLEQIQQRSPDFDPHFRIGQLEGAIKGAILMLESNVLWLSCSGSSLAGVEADKTRKVIANLKQLIGDSK